MIKEAAKLDGTWQGQDGLKASRCKAVGAQISQRWSLLDRDGDRKLSSGEFWLSVQCQAEFWHSIGMLEHFDTLQRLWRVPKESSVWVDFFEGFPQDFTGSVCAGADSSISFSTWAYLQHRVRESYMEFAVKHCEALQVLSLIHI